MNRRLSHVAEKPGRIRRGIRFLAVDLFERNRLHVIAEPRAVHAIANIARQDGHRAIFGNLPRAGTPCAYGNIAVVGGVGVSHASVDQRVFIICGTVRRGFPCALRRRPSAICARQHKRGAELEAFERGGTGEHVRSILESQGIEARKIKRGQLVAAIEQIFHVDGGRGVPAGKVKRREPRAEIEHGTHVCDMGNIQAGKIQLGKRFATREHVYRGLEMRGIKAGKVDGLEIRATEKCAAQARC